MPSVLFICTGNLYRSPIAAAAFLRRLEQEGLSERWVVSSAGTWTRTGLPAHPEALLAAKDLGLDLSGHRSRVVDAEVLAGNDLIVVMEQGHKEALVNEFPAVRGKIHLLSELAEQLPYDIADPVNMDVDGRMVAGQVCELVEQGYTEISRLAKSRRGHKS